MTTKKGAVLNKAEAIRQALAKHPAKGPAEIARMLTARHGVPFHRKKVSALKVQVGRPKAPAPKAAAPAAARKTSSSPPSVRSGAPAAAKGVAEMVTNLQAYIRRLGKADLHRLIDTL
jgi:hypothetical protein